MSEKSKNIIVKKESVRDHQAEDRKIHVNPTVRIVFCFILKYLIKNINPISKEISTNIKLNNPEIISISVKSLIPMILSLVIKL